MPEIAKALSNVFFDTAATVFLYKPEIFKQMSHIISSDKILFGTDYPLMHQNRVLAQIQSSQLPEEDKARILGANAQKLLHLDERSRSVP
jgi:predicted TIM-barrel fold metal-dependent hydrolase